MMISTEIDVERRPRKLNNPVLVVGLPGVGLVGRLSVTYALKKIKKKQRIAKLYSPYFPPTTLMLNNGKLRLLSMSFHLVRGKKRDVIFLTGDTQPTEPWGHYEVARKILDFAEKLGVKEIITIGGYSQGQLSNRGRLFALVNHSKLKKRFEKRGLVFGEAKGSIFGLAGLIPGLARRRKIKATCILAETFGGFVDPIAAEKVVRIIFNDYLGLDIDLSDLDKASKEIEKAIRKVEEEIAKQINKKSDDLSYIR